MEALFRTENFIPETIVLVQKGECCRKRLKIYIFYSKFFKYSIYLKV